MAVVVMQRIRRANRTTALGAVFLLAGCASGADETVPSSTSPGSSVITPTTFDASAGTTLSTTSPTPEPITRPYVDPAVCGSGARSEYVSQNTTRVPFAVGSTSKQPIPLQVFAFASEGVAKPFAIVLRLPATSNDRSNNHPVLIKGVKVSISVWPNGNAAAAWTLPDGTWAYLRSRDLDEAAIVALITRLTPREWSADIPGFDLAPSATPDDLTLLHEDLSTGLSGTTTHFECTAAPEGGVYRIDVLQGDPLYVFFGILDRPRPYAVGVNGSGATTITGPRTTRQITLADIVNADPATWDALPRGG